MSGITEYDIQDLLRKTEEHLSTLTVEERESALNELRETLRSYAHTVPGADFYKVKQAVGGPRGLANMLLLKARRPLEFSNYQANRRIVMVTLIASVIAFFMLLGFLWWKFTPILSVENDRVQVLGGLIDIDGQLGQVKFGDSYEFSDSQFKNVFEGSYEVPTEMVEDVQIEFDRGQLEVIYTQETRINWNCKLSNEPSDGFIRQEKDLLIVSFKNIGGVDCQVKVPAKLSYTITGDAGKVDLVAPAADTFVQLGNGMVTIAPDSEYSYKFDLKLGQGLVDPAFNGLSQDDGLEIKVELGNGQIQKK